MSIFSSSLMRTSVHRHSRTTHTRVLSLSLICLWCCGWMFGCVVGLDRAEQLFRQTKTAYQAKVRERDPNSWNVWSDLANKLLVFIENKSNNNEEEASSSTTNGPSLLQTIGALEESILVIETVIYKQGQADNPIRDRALAHLYYAYSKALVSLTAQQCHTLALDPHTFIIGAETVTDEPSTHLCRENAENHLRNAVTLDATHQQATELLAAMLQQSATADGIHQRKPKEFVAELFDSFADSFDEKLVKGLAYQVPALVGQAAAAHAPHYKAVLDAGCGTGLAGRYLKPLVPTGPLIGVDASEKMLAIARACTTHTGCGLEQNEETLSEEQKATDSPLYSGLFAMDLEDMTVKATLHSSDSGLSGFDLVVAADVLVYFGRLDAVLSSFAAVSTPGAVLIFSCERTNSEEAPLGWRLLPSGRFAHTKEHAVESSASAGYVLKEYSEIVPRMEKGEPVQGHLFTFVLQPQGNDEL